MCEERGSKMDRVIGLLEQVVKNTNPQKMKTSNTTPLGPSKIKVGDVVVFNDTRVGDSTYHSVQEVKWDRMHWMVKLYDGGIWYDAAFLEVVTHAK